MRSDLSLIFALLGASAWAAPGAESKNKCKRASSAAGTTTSSIRTSSAVCNADNCLRAVRATSAKPFAASATADCSSFMRKTVTPCAVTSTNTVTVTSVASPSSVFATAVVDVTQIDSVFETITSVVATNEYTVTFIQPTEVDVINIIVAPTTVTAAQGAKRGLHIEPLPTVPGVDVQRRIEQRTVVPFSTTSAGTCAATTNAPSSVPTYASACSGTARYSSACSCAGITGDTTTLTASTVFVTSVATATSIPTVTVTNTITNQIPVTVVSTQVVPTTFETTDATLIVQSAFTITSDIIIPTTVVVSPPVCTSYKFVATNGVRAGQFLAGGTPDPSLITYGFVNFTSDPSAAMTFNIRPDGRVYGGNNQYGWVTNGNSLYYVLQMTDRAQSFYGIRSVTCSVGTGGSSYPGAVGALSCSDGGNPNNLVYCPQTSNNLARTNAGGFGGCTSANLAALLAC